MNWPTKKLGKTDLRILVLAKAMYMRGCVFADDKDEISRMLAIHTFDNTAEVVLRLLAKVKNITPEKTRGRWEFHDLLRKVCDEEVFKDQIDALHQQRNRVHHAGDIPAIETIAKYRTHTEDFIKNVCKKEFGISYKELSLASLITHTELQDLYKKAEWSFEQKKYKESIEFSEEVFHKTVFDIADIFSKAGTLTGYFKGGNELSEIIKENYAEKYKDKEHYGLAKELSKAVLQLGQAATTMQFLDEYRVDFLEHRKRVENLEQIPKENLKDESMRSLRFVLNIILKWQGENIL